eukprot:gene4452-6297_t
MSKSAINKEAFIAKINPVGTTNEFNPEKKWTNGHKFFDAQQSKGFVELLKTEERTRMKYNTEMKTMIKPRNPLNGDITPRNRNGFKVINPNLYADAVVGSIPLFPEDSAKKQEESDSLKKSSIRLTKTKQTALNDKIVVPSSKYDILGNTVKYNNEVPDSISTDLFYYAKQVKNDKTEIQRENEERNKYILQEKAKRQQKLLQQQILTLQRQALEKEKEIERISNTYKL